MKTLKGLNDPVPLLEIKPSDTIAPTIKEVLVTEISMEMSTRGVEAVRLMKLGMSIASAKDTVDLEDAEYDLLKKVLRTPKQRGGVPIGYNSAIIGAVEMKLFTVGGTIE